MQLYFRSSCKKIYKAYVRPTLEVWNPYIAKDINKLEQIQKSASRFVKGNYNYYESTTAMVTSLVLSIKIVHNIDRLWWAL